MSRADTEDSDLAWQSDPSPDEATRMSESGYPGPKFVAPPSGGGSEDARPAEAGATNGNGGGNGDGRAYRWRRLSPEQRAQVLAARKREGLPWHSPPHFVIDHPMDFHITAACYEHRPVIGYSTERLEAFSRALLDTLQPVAIQVHAWCLLPNHYHLLVRIASVKTLALALGKLHGRCSHQWNGEEATRGRQVFHRIADRAIRSERHFWATLNYIHHNPVHHRYVAQWSEWPWSSAVDFLERAGREEALRIWRAYPVKDYGRGWDDADL